MRIRAVQAREPREELKSLAGVGVADSEREEAEPKDQHDNVQHEMLLAAVFPAAAVALLRTAELQWIKRNKRLIARDREVPRCTYVFEMAVTATLLEGNKCREVLT